MKKAVFMWCPLMESLALPDGMQAVANAKSSTGRLDLLTRTITDGGVEFDRIAPGYHGPLYAEICPRSFSVLVRPGMRLNQIRFRSGHAVLDDAALNALHAHSPLVDGTAVIDDGLGFSVDLELPGSDLVGYRAKPHTGVIDLDRIGYYNPAEYWEDVRTTNGQIILDPGAFYILVSREAVTFRPNTRRKWPLIWQWSANFGCITQDSLTPVSAMTPQAGPARAACWKCAATKRRLFWNTGRLWGVWSMNGCRMCPRNYTAQAFLPTIRVRA